MLRFRDSAFDHGITKEQIEDVLVNKYSLTKWFEIHDDDEGNAQDMVVGFDSEGIYLIEIGITYLEEDEVVFHAMKATKPFRNKYSAS